MKIFLAVLAALLFLLGVLLCAKIRIVFEYCKNQGEKLTANISIRIFGINIKRLKAKPKSPEKQKKDEDDSKDSLTDRINRISSTVSIVHETYKRNRWFIKKRLTVENIEIYVKFGLGDAAATGIAAGALWALLYQALAFVCCIGTVCRHSFDVVPVFEDNGFCSSGKGIISFRLINIIVAYMRLYTTYKSLEKGYKKQKRRR